LLLYLNVSKQAAFREKYGASKRLTNQAAASYYALRLPEEAKQWVLRLGDVVYRANSDPTRVPHLSVYENFKPSERFGKSVFHLTWYGVGQQAVDSGLLSAAAGVQEVFEECQVIVRVYFGQTGDYLYSQVISLSGRPERGGAAAAAAASAATAASDEIVLAPQETALLRRHAVQCASPLMTEILQFVNQQADDAAVKVRTSLSALEGIRAPQGMQRNKYIQIARTCIAEIKSLSQWRFEGTDPRLNWLQAVVSGLSGQQQIHAAQVAAASPALFSASDEGDASAAAPVSVAVPKASQRPKPKGAKTKGKAQRRAQAKAAAKRQANELGRSLRAVETELEALEADSTIDDVDKALQKLNLFERQVNIIVSHNFAGDSVKINAVFKSLREQQEHVQFLFMKKALDNDLSAVKKLTPFVPDIEALFFIKLVFDVGDIPLITHVIDHFPQVMIFLNNYAVGVGDSEDQTEYKPIMMHLLDKDDSLDLFAMLLERGANPNVTSVSDMRTGHTLLDEAVRKKLTQHVRLLLLHGADFYFDVSTIVQKSQLNVASNSAAEVAAELERQRRTLSDRKIRRAVVRQQAEAAIVRREQRYTPPFINAILTHQHQMVELFLAFNVPLGVKVDKKFDALGYVFCSREAELDSKMLDLLVTAGADVNAYQDPGRTILQVLLQENRLASAKHLLRVGADPNANIEVQLFKGMAFPHSVFFHAVATKNINFTRLFLDNKRVPVSIPTYLRALGYCLVLVSRFHLTMPDLKVVTDFTEGDEITPLLYEYSDNFTSDPIALSSAVDEVLAEAKAYKGGHNFFHMSLYMSGLLFGEPAVRHQACFDIGRCLESIDPAMSISFYTPASQYTGSEAVARQAREALQRLGAADPAATAAAEPGGVLRPGT